MANNVNPNCDLYLAGHDCVSEMDTLVCVTCRDFHEVGYGADTRAEVTSPDVLDRWDGYMESEPWNDRHGDRF